MLKFLNNQTILRIINEKQGNADSGIHSNVTYTAVCRPPACVFHAELKKNLFNI